MKKIFIYRNIDIPCIKEFRTIDEILEVFPNAKYGGASISTGYIELNKKIGIKINYVMPSPEEIEIALEHFGLENLDWNTFIVDHIYLL
jgi:hypothetical protein